MEELIYELSAPLSGTGNGVLVQFFLNVICPLLLIVIIVSAILHWKGQHRVYMTVYAVVTTVVFLGAAVAAFTRLDLAEYIKNTKEDSKFIEDNYVDGSAVDLTFPAKKRNLIYIFLESVETTYSDKENGGAFTFDCIPELTELAEENECFSGGGLNGGMILPGTTWTMGGMFAQTSGLPLKISIGENMMSTQKDFFPDITTLGDILYKEGYKQVLLLGSDAEFGGRKTYFSQHGNYEMLDYGYAVENGKIPEDYYVWWGYEDEKLFAFAKEELMSLSQSDEPFNLTMLTVDTHFEDGYVCDLCSDEFGENQYANVMACSSRQVADFVAWIRQQDFYENTTIVLVGDHTTMDSDFCDDADDDYARKAYLSIINSAIEKKRDGDIEYSTLDMFPTTLAAMGVEIEGDQLGLGVNLFSDKKTLIEQNGFDVVAAEFNKGSKLMVQLAGIDMENEELMQEEGWFPDATTCVTDYSPESGTITVVVDDIVNVSDVEEVTLSLADTTGKSVYDCVMELNADRSYSAEVSIRDLPNHEGTITVSAQTSDGRAYKLDELGGDLTFQAHDNIDNYLSLLKGRDDIAVIMTAYGYKAYPVDGVTDNLLRDLGVRNSLSKNRDAGFYAVIDKNHETDDVAEGCLSYDGILSNGIRYSLNSVPGGCDGDFYITIDGGDYSSPDGDSSFPGGLHIVVYSLVENGVIDNAVFDMSDWSIPSCVVSAEESGKYAEISVSRIETDDDVTRFSARGELWDDKTRSHPILFDLTGNSADRLSASVKVRNIDTENCYLKVYLKNEKTLVETLAIDWRGNLGLLKGSIVPYLDNIRENYSDRLVVICSRDEASRGLSDEVIAAMRRFGMTKLNKDSYRQCYYYASVGDQMIEQIDGDRINWKGTIGGVDLAISGESYDLRNYSSIKIQDEEYSLNERGLNIVVYDLEKQRVDDVVNFDLHLDSNRMRR